MNNYANWLTIYDKTLTMPANTPQKRIYRFGEFLLYENDRRLMRDGERVQLTPRSLHLLLVLVENAGRIVSKESLINEIWEEAFVEEGNLNQTVSRLRKVLGETANENRFIETVPRVGYRFFADVEVSSEEEIAAPSTREEPTSVTAVNEPAPLQVRRLSRGWLIAVATLIVVASIVLSGWFWLTPEAAQPVRGKQKGIPIRLTDSLQNESRAMWTPDGRARFGRSSGKETSAYIMNADGSDQRLDTSVSELRAGLWSPDDSKVIFYKVGDAGNTLYLANSDGSNEIKLPFKAGNMAWSPDNGKILYQFGNPDSDLFIYTLESGNIDTVVSTPTFDADPSFSPDGRKIAYVSSRDGNPEIYVQNIDGSDLQRLTNHPAHDGFPTFSPDGTQILFNSNREDENFDVYLMNADGSNVRRLTNWKSDEEAYPGCWSPDGTEILFSSDHSRKINIYKMSVEPIDLKEVLAVDNEQLQFPSYSHDGSKLLYQTENDEKVAKLSVLDLKTKTTTTVVRSEQGGMFPRFSPNGNEIIYQDKIDGNAEICIISADGSGSFTNLTNNPARDTAPVFSPDGSKIVFTSNREGNYDLFQLYMMNADGSNQHRIYYSGAASNYPSWSPDGQKIVFSNDKEDGRTGNFEIFLIEPETISAEIRLTFRRRYDTYPVFSPDGSRIAFTSAADGNSEIYIMNADGSRLVRLTRDAAEDIQPSWSPDGKRIIFSSNRSGRFAIYELAAD